MDQFREKWISRLAAFTIERAGDVVLWISANGDIHHANAEACRRYGYTYEELTSLTIFKLNETFTPERLAQWFDHLRTEGVALAESFHWTKSGTPIPVEINSNYIEFEGQEFTCSIVRDISQRIEKEKMLREAFEEIEALKERLEAENDYLQEELGQSHNLGEIVSQSKAFQQVLIQVDQVARTSSTVLISGESGTGKELIARALHKLSQRSERPMIKVNCAALPANLIESELFGYEKGAFTGANISRQGRFSLAHKGTLFLDEIGEMPLELQSKLLRAIQEGEFEPLGSGKTVRVDVRIIAATNRDLQQRVQEGEFREDLYYRLNVFPIHCLPLRERKEDIPMLVRHFCKKLETRVGKQITKIPRRVMEQLSAYDYPGNIRELENIVERAVIVSSGGTLEVGNWLPKARKALPREQLPTLEALQREHIVAVLKLTEWRVSGERGAAIILGLKPSTLESKMKKLGIHRSTDSA